MNTLVHKNIDEKIQRCKNSRRSKFVINFRIVFVTRGKVKILFKEVKLLLNHSICQIKIERNIWNLYAIKVIGYHIYLFVSLDSKMSTPRKIRGEVKERILSSFQF